MSRHLHMELGFMENSRPDTVTVLYERNLSALHTFVLLSESMSYVSFLLTFTACEGGPSRGLHVGALFRIIGSSDHVYRRQRQKNEVNTRTNWVIGAVSFEELGLHCFLDLSLGFMLLRYISFSPFTKETSLFGAVSSPSEYIYNTVYIPTDEGSFWKT
ncbi:hypothetical protein STEG23_023449, partial [Scotinomys teguina]